MKRPILVMLGVAVLSLIGFASYVFVTTRPTPQNQYDLPILERTVILLQSENGWSKQDDRRCNPDETKLSLYCALWQASIDVTGEFQHRAAALQEVRLVIDELYPENAYSHRLMDFNNAAEISRRGRACGSRGGYRELEAQKDIATILNTTGKPSVKMADQWLFKSETYDNCNCAVNCGCQFNLPSTHGHCQSAFVGDIVEGHFNDTPLAGLNWAALYKWPGEIADGNGKRQIVIDVRADEAQRVALETIISGEACKELSNHFAVFASTCAESCETLFLPIELEANPELRTARVDIPGIMRSRGKPIINVFNGEPFHVALARRSGSFEFTYAEIGLGTTTVTGEMEMAFEDTWAHYCVHHFDQDGLVREPSGLAAWLGGADPR